MFAGDDGQLEFALTGHPSQTCSRKLAVQLCCGFFQCEQSAHLRSHEGRMALATRSSGTPQTQTQTHYEWAVVYLPLT